MKDYKRLDVRNEKVKHKKPFFRGKEFQYKGIYFTFYGVYGKAVRVVLIPKTEEFSDFQKIFIPLKHFDEFGNLKNENIDYCFRKRIHILELAGYFGAIIGIKRKTKTEALE